MCLIIRVGFGIWLSMTSHIKSSKCVGQRLNVANCQCSSAMWLTHVLKDRVERTKDHQQRTKTELNCQCVIELRVFLCLLCILSLKIELCIVYPVSPVKTTVLQLWSPGIFCVDSSVDKLSCELLPMLYVLFLLDWTSQPVELFWRDCMFLFV